MLLLVVVTDFRTIAGIAPHTILLLQEKCWVALAAVAVVEHNNLDCILRVIAVAVVAAAVALRVQIA